MSGTRLVGDIGATNARFAIAENSALCEIRHYAGKDFASLADAAREYLNSLPQDALPRTAALAVAGPVSGDEIALTNLHWSFSVRALKAALGLSHLVVVNDFAGTAMAIPFLPQHDRCWIGPAKPAASGPIGVIGPGTGLGICSLVRSAGQWILLPGEGGHATLPAGTSEEAGVIYILRKHWPHVSAERVLSGAGLVNVYQALCAIGGHKPEPLSPADITDRAMLGHDQTCVQTFAMFCAMLGDVAGNLALTIGATGGIYVAGGILPRFKEAFAASPFRARFEDKGRLSEFLRNIPTILILDDAPALLGLAHLPIPDTQ